MNLNKYGEVADFTYPVDQFGRSQYACGPYAVGYIKCMGAPGQGAGATADVDFWAVKMYTTYIGADTISNMNGTSLDQLYAMLSETSASMPKPFTYLKLPLSMDAIKTSIALGHPVIVAAAETGMHDADNGDKVDYSWTPTGNHIITISGVRTSDGALAVRDPANIGASGQRGSGPANVHDGPLFYNASKFGPIVSVTAIVPAWLSPTQPPAPVTTTQPLKTALIVVISAAQALLKML